MESVSKLIDKAFAIIVFIGAVTLFIKLNRGIHNLHLEIKYRDQNKVVYQKESPLYVELTTGGDILSEIYKGLETDITIDGYVIRKDAALTSIDISKINLKSNYKRVVKILNGRVQSINYTKE